MRRLRLAILGDSPCELCTAACCRQNGHSYAVLLESDERRKFAPFAVEVVVDRDGYPVVEMALPYRERRCTFLGADNLCTIYADRPSNCRRFQCVGGYHLGGGDLARHSEFLERNPQVLGVLEAL